MQESQTTQGTVARSLLSGLAVVADAARLLWRHWPVLLVIYLLGAAGHNGFLWLAVAVSEHQPTVAGFILPLVPISTLVALILMLRALAPSLPNVAPDAAVDPAIEPVVDAEDTEDTEPPADPVGWRGRVRTAYLSGRSLTTARLALLAGAIIPFLTLYASEGSLARDRIAFVGAAYADEFRERGITYGLETAMNNDRYFIATGWALAGLIGLALLLRWALDRFGLPAKALGWGLFAAYLEVLWLFLLAHQFTGLKDWGWGWLMSRRFSAWASDRWEAFLGFLGPFADPVGSTTGWLVGALGRGDQLILLPIAWLTVAAVVYGRSLPSIPRAGTVGSQFMAPLAERVPAPVKKAWDELTGGFRGRFRRLFDGIRLLVSAGLVPMLLFCLAFILARQVGYAAQELARVVIGPQLVSDRIAFAPHVRLFTDGVHTMVLVVLLGAALDRIIGRTSPPAETPPAAPQPRGTQTTPRPAPADGRPA